MGNGKWEIEFAAEGRGQNADPFLQLQSKIFKINGGGYVISWA